MSHAVSHELCLGTAQESYCTGKTSGLVDSRPLPSNRNHPCFTLDVALAHLVLLAAYSVSHGELCNQDTRFLVKPSQKGTLKTHI